MIVAGGVYREECARPRWKRIFGSGCRAITAVSALSPGSELRAYANADWVPGLQASGAACGYTVSIEPIAQKITFEYLHPLSKPKLFPAIIPLHEPLTATGDVVLRFGFVEGDAVVSGRRVVYDPQTGNEPSPFFANGSSCEELAVVLNAREAFLATDKEPEEAAKQLMRDWAAHVVVVKLGTQGALVCDRNGLTQTVDAYRSERVFKIGSGDVFSAIFAHCWGEKGMPPLQAAEHASAAVAQYVETRSLPFSVLPEGTGRKKCVAKSPAPYIYLAGPFFDVSQRWMIDEALALLEGLGAEVFSPIHHVGSAENVPNAALLDLEELRKVDAVLAFVDSRDPGTILEVGYARALEEPAKPKPVVILAERLREHELTMFKGSDCFITNDFATALYRAVWAAD